VDRETSQILREVAFAAADAAAAVTLAYFRSGRLATQNKAADGFDPVTRADREAEAAIRAVIRQHRPMDGILGEEQGAETGASGFTWIVDPIDGTRGFMSGTPTWGTLISVDFEGRPVFGLIDQPYTGERFVGGPGQSVLLRGADQIELKTRATDSLSDAVLFTTFPEIGSADEQQAFAALSARARLTRYGMDCYAYALVAAGQIDLVAEAGLHVYDYHAPMAVIEAAGGIVSNWRGGPPDGDGRILAAANAELHSAAVDILGRA